MSILDEYVMHFPSAQNAIDIFKDEWASHIPGGYSSGQAPLFADSRITAIGETIGGFVGKSVLELGPLEAAHTYMMSNAGAAHVLGIEAHSRAYLRCLVVKETLNLTSVNFLLGDLDKYLETEETSYDLILAAGVVYHCLNPVKTIVNMTRRADTIGIWSHYFTEAQVRPKYGKKFDYKGKVLTYDGYEARCFEHDYRDALEIKGFCGGGNPSTRWMDRESWLSLFEQLGYDFHILSESEDHPNGPEFTAVAQRRQL